MPGAGIVPGVGALLRRAGKRFEHLDVQRRLELLQHDPERGAHDAGADEHDIGLRNGTISNHGSLRSERSAAAAAPAPAAASGAGAGSAVPFGGSISERAA